MAYKISSSVLRQYKASLICSSTIIEYKSNNGPENNAACSANDRHIGMHNTLDVDMTSATVASLLEMGYTREMVKDTVVRYRQIYGNRTMKPDSLMNMILDSEDSQNTQTSQSSLEHTASNMHNKNATNRKDKEVKKKTNESAKTSTKLDYTSLIKENRSLRDQLMCKICMDNNANIVFQPCGHLVACTECAQAIGKCVVCRKRIKGTVKAFPS